jgi:hypothetical protein
MVDLNPLHYIDEFNHMCGDSVASGLEFMGRPRERVPRVGLVPH